MWFTKTTSRVARFFKSSDAVVAKYEGCSPAVSSLRLVLERDDARRARASKGKRVPLLPSRKNGVVIKKTVESNGVVKSDCDDEQDRLLAIGPEAFEEENPVENLIGVEEGAKVAATTCEDVLDGLMHIGPEVFEGDGAKDMGLGEECWNANVPAGIARSTTSKEESVQRWIDSMKFMEKDKGIQGGITANGGGDRYPHHRHASFTAEGSRHDYAAEYDVLSVIEEVDEMDTSGDDEKTVITAIEVPIQNDNVIPETRFHGDFSDQGWNGDLPALLDTLDEPDLPDMGPEEDMPIATFTINKKASKTASNGGEIDPVTAMIADLTQRKARYNPVTPPRHYPGTEAWSGDSPTLLEIQDDSEIPDTMPETEPPATLESNQERDGPTTDNKASDFAAVMKARNTGTDATVEAPIASSCANANALPKLKDQKIENETTAKHSDAEDLSQALVVEDVKAKRGLDDPEGNIVPSRARMREDLIAQAKEKLASLYYVSTGQSKDIRISSMAETQTTTCGHAMSATNEDSILITGGLKTASKMEATVQSTPISLETTHEAWLVMHKPDREAYVAAHRAIIDYDVADIKFEVEASRAAYRSELEQEKEKFHSRLDTQLEELEARKAQLKAEIADSEKKSARVQEQTTSSRKQETEDLERRWWQAQFTAKKNAEMAAMADEADAYLSDLDSELQYTKDLLNTTINERDEALRAVHNLNLAVSRDTHVVRTQNLNIVQLDVQAKGMVKEKGAIVNQLMEANSKAEKLENENQVLRMALSTAETTQLSGYQWPWNWRRGRIE